MADSKTKALHSAARRYCIDRIEAGAARRFARDREQLGERTEWSRFETAFQNYQAAALNDLAQISALPDDDQDTGLLSSILTEIERSTPDDFRSVAEARDSLLSAGHRAKINFRQVRWGRGEVEVQEWEPDWTEVQQSALERTRAAYSTYIAALTPQQSASIAPVPFRHVMSDTKRRRVGKQLAKRWNIDPLWQYWHPLWDEPTPPDVLALQDYYFYKEFGPKKLQAILLRRGIARMWELNEQRLDPEYEMDPRLCQFAYSLETYWSSRQLDWLVYASHESSITFAGGWLIAAIKESWPNWQQRIYTGWTYEQA